MSVPAFKNSKSKVRRRRSHHALKPIQLLKDKVTGEYSRHHHSAEVAPVKLGVTKSGSAGEIVKPVVKPAKGGSSTAGKAKEPKTEEEKKK